MWEIIMRNWDLKVIHVWVNWPFHILHENLPIRQVHKLLWHHPNPIRPVVHLICNIHLYPPIFIPHLTFMSTTLPLSPNTRLSHLTPSLNVMISRSHRPQHSLCRLYSELRILKVQNMLCAASDQDWLSSHHSHHYVLPPECRFSGHHASLHDRPPPARSPSELNVNVFLFHSHSCELTNWWLIESPHPALLPSTASMFSTNFPVS